MQALFLFLILTTYHQAKAEESQVLSQNLKKIFTHAENKKNFSEEFSQLKVMSERDKQALVTVWESPEYPWKWRWLSVMYMAEYMMPGAEQKILQGLKDPFFLMRLASITALSGQKNLEPYQTELIACLKDDSLVVRKAAIKALSIKPNQQVIQAIEKAMFDDKNRLQNQQDLMGILQSMLEVIVSYNDKQSIHTLAKLIKRSNIESKFKIQVCNALKSLVENNSMPIEQAIFKQERDCAYHWQRWYQQHQGNI